MSKAVTGKTLKSRKTVVKPEVKTVTPVEEPVAYDNTGEDWDQEYEEQKTQDDGEGYDQGEGNEESEPMEEEEIEGEAEKLEEQEEEDPTVLFRMYVARTSKMLSSGDIKKFLNIKQVKVMKVTQPEWIPIAEVRVCDAEDKEKLMSLSGRTVGGYDVKFEVAGESDISLQTPQIGGCSVVLAEGLSAAATVHDLQELFPNAREVRVPIPKAGEKRTALLEFNTANEAEEVIENKQGIKLHDEELMLSAHKVSTLAPSVGVPPLSTEDITTTDENKKVLFIGNLLYETVEKTVKDYFDTCKSVRLLKFGTRGKSKGMGFIHFNTAADALKALIEKKDTKLEGRQILLQFADGERRTAEDYRNNPGKTGSSTKNLKERPKPYTPPAAKKNLSNRWYSRAEVEKGLSFANDKQTSQWEMKKEEQQTSRALKVPRERSEVGAWTGRPQRPVGTGMGRAIVSKTSSIPGAVGRGFSSTRGSMVSGYSAGQRAVDRGFNNARAAVGGGFRNEHDGMARRGFSNTREAIAGGYSAGHRAVDTGFNNGRAAVGGGFRNEHDGMARHGFSNTREAMAGGYSAGQEAVDRGLAGGFRNEHDGMARRYDDGRAFMARGIANTTDDYSAPGSTGLLSTPKFDRRDERQDYTRSGLASGLGLQSDRAEAPYRAPGLDAHMDLQEELERTRRLERRLQMALEKRTRGTGLGDGHREFSTGAERAVWRDDGNSMRAGQYDSYDRYDQGSYAW